MCIYVQNYVIYNEKRIYMHTKYMFCFYHHVSCVYLNVNYDYTGLREERKKKEGSPFSAKMRKFSEIFVCKTCFFSSFHSNSFYLWCHLLCSFSHFTSCVWNRKRRGSFINVHCITTSSLISFSFSFHPCSRNIPDTFSIVRWFSTNGWMNVV